MAAAAAGQGSNTGRTVDIAVGVTVGVLALLAALLALLYFRQRNAPRTRPHKALPDLPGMRTVNPTLPTSTSNSPYGDWGTMQRNGVVGGGEYDYDAFAHHRSAPSLAMIEAAGTSGQAGAYLGGSAAQYALGGQSLGAAATSVYSTNAAGYGVYGAGIAAGAAAAAHDPYAAYDQNRAYNPQDSDSSPIDFSSHAPYGDDVYGSMSEENPHSRASIGGSSNDHFYPALSSVPDLPLMSDEGETGSR